MSMYGYEIVQTLIVDIEPDEHVKRAMNEINAGKFHTFLVHSIYELHVSNTHCKLIPMLHLEWHGLKRLAT